jgi:hypothetical protein
MIIINRGNPLAVPRKWWSQRIIDCEKCRASFQLEESDAHLVVFGFIPPSIMVDCPTCRREIVVFKDNDSNR